jgi:hypothetical protein
MFDNQQNLQSGRQDAEQDFLQKQNAATEAKAKIAHSSAAITNDLLASFGDLAAVVDRNKAAADEQRAKMSSGNPLDAIEAIGNQIIDPSLYTRAGRQKTLNETQQYVNAKVAIAGAQQDALTALSNRVDADLLVAGQPLAQAKLNEQQGMERIQTERLKNAAIAENLATNTQMQQTALMNLDSTQIAALKQKANGQPVDVGGILIQPGILQERADQLAQRQDMIEARENALELKKAEQAKKLNRKILETHSLEELRPMLLSGDPTGQFDLKDIQEVYGIKQQAQSDAIERASQGLQLGNFMSSIVVPTDSQVQTMRGTVPQGTPLAAEVDKLDFTNQMVAKTIKQYEDAGVQPPIEVLTMANEAIQKGKEDVNKAIDKQATLAARGDSNMKELYTERFRGNPLPAPSVEAAIQTRLSNNKPLTDVLPKEVADEVQRLYRDKVQKLTAASKIGGIGTADKKAIEQQAQTEALNEAVANTIQNRTNGLLTDQIDIPGNPLAGVIDKGGFLTMVAAADAEGKTILQQRYQLTDEEMQRALQGETIPGKTPGDIRADLGLIQNTQLFFKLDTQQAGLAQKYAAWWNLQGDSYINQRAQQNTLGAGAKDLQSQALESFATPIELQGSQAYRSSIGGAASYYGQAKDEKYQQMITFDSNPTYRQAVLLQMDKDLTNPEKTAFMQNFIMPIVADAKNNGKDFNETNKMIEQALDMGVAPDPQTQKILNKIVRNRPTVNAQLDAMTTNPWWSASMITGLGMGGDAVSATDLQIRGRTNADGYDWFKNLIKTNQSPSSSNEQSTTPGGTSRGFFDIISGITGDFRNNMQATDRSLGKNAGVK